MTALHRFARLSAACAFLLLVAGGMVTSTGSSLAVPDWPLAFGQYFPKMTGGVLFEHGHRLVAGAVALLTAILTAWVWLREERPWVRWLAACALAGILVQAALGAVTVLYSLPKQLHQVSIAHAVLGQTVFCLILSVAQVTSPWYLQEARSSSAAVIPVPILWVGLAVALVFAQLVLGAILRHTGQNAWQHIAMALVVSGAVLWVATHTSIGRAGETALTRPAALLMVLVPAQLALGLGAFLLRDGPRTPVALWQAALRTGHVACGAAILGTCVVLGLRLWKVS